MVRDDLLAVVELAVDEGSFPLCCGWVFDTRQFMV